MIHKDSPTITMGTGPLYLIPLKVCNIRARTVTVCGACFGSYFNLSLTPKFVCFCFPLFGVMFAFSAEVFYGFRGLKVCLFCAGFVYHLLQFFWIFEHWARTQMIVVKWLIVMVSHKQWLAQCIKHAHFFNVCT